MASPPEPADEDLEVDHTVQAREILRRCKRGARTGEDLAALIAWARTTNSFSTMPEAEIESICQDMYLRTLQPGEPLFYQGQNPDAFCVLMSGRLGLYLLPERDAADKIEEVKKVGIDTIVSMRLYSQHFFGQRMKEISQPGEGFGELAIITGQRRAAGAIAELETLVVKVSISTYNGCLRSMHGDWAQISEKVGYLQKMSAFSFWKLPELMRLAYCMEDCIYRRGRWICSHGQQATNLFVIKSGECVVMKDKVLLATLRDGDMFGEDVMLAGGSTYNLSVMANSNVEAFKMSFYDFNKLTPGSQGRQTMSVMRATNAMRRSWRRQYIKKASKEKARVMKLVHGSNSSSELPQVKFFKSQLDLNEDTIRAWAVPNHASPRAQTAGLAGLPSMPTSAPPGYQTSRPSTSPSFAASPSNLERPSSSPSRGRLVSDFPTSLAVAEPALSSTQLDRLGQHSFATARLGFDPAFPIRAQSSPSPNRVATAVTEKPKRYSRI